MALLPELAPVNELTVFLFLISLVVLAGTIFQSNHSLLVLYFLQRHLRRNPSEIALLNFGTILDLLHASPDKDISNIIRLHLIETLLPDAQNWKTLTSTQTRFALKRLIRTRKPELLLAVLQSLERGGTRDAIPFVEALANGKFLAAKDETIRCAAQESLLALKERAEAKASEGELLRPSEKFDPASLLRSSTPANETDPAQLLRATTGENISE